MIENKKRNKSQNPIFSYSWFKKKIGLRGSKGSAFGYFQPVASYGPTPPLLIKVQAQKYVVNYRINSSYTD